MIQLLLAIIYLSFISLGLPDGLLGAGWPAIYPELSVPVSFAGIVSMIMCVGTIAASLMSDRLTRRFGTGRVTAFSVAMTAGALLGFSCSDSFWMICLWAIPYGLGAGGVDASINNYVALHYSSKHMSWLHCMWGVGALTGPYVMGFALEADLGWRSGYRWIGLLQVGLTAILLLSLKQWKGRAPTESAKKREKALSLAGIWRIKGVPEVMTAFFCYCALELTAMLWGSSYLVLHKGIDPETAAFFGSLFFIGITAGRALNGFLTIRFSDTQLIRMGQAVIGVGILILVLPLGNWAALAGLLLVGFGCAPIYPCVIHSTPAHFGAENSQAIIGVQMASAYVGSGLMPPLFGLVANHVSPGLFPWYLLGILVLMFMMHERLVRKCGAV